MFGVTQTDNFQYQNQIVDIDNLTQRDQRKNVLITDKNFSSLKCFGNKAFISVQLYLCCYMMLHLKLNINLVFNSRSTTHTSLSPIRRGFTPGFVSYKKWCTRLAAANDKAYQLLAHGRWFSPGTPASATTKTGHHDIVEILLKWH